MFLLNFCLVLIETYRRYIHQRAPPKQRFESKLQGKRKKGIWRISVILIAADFIHLNLVIVGWCLLFVNTNTISAYNGEEELPPRELRHFERSF